MKKFKNLKYEFSQEMGLSHRLEKKKKVKKITKKAGKKY